MTKSCSDLQARLEELSKTQQVLLDKIRSLEQEEADEGECRGLGTLRVVQRWG